jgi:hypothetical protein
VLAHPSRCSGTVDPASVAWHSYATMKARVRVVLAEDSYLVREGVRRLLETDPDIELTSCCVDLARFNDWADPVPQRIATTFGRGCAKVGSPRINHAKQLTEADSAIGHGFLTDDLEIRVGSTSPLEERRRSWQSRKSLRPALPALSECTATIDRRRLT